jgi:acetamidase/formamidase
LRGEPRLTIHSGDTVSIETLSHALGQIKPGVEMDEIVKLRKQNDGGGPHSITGPIYVEGAEPGDTLAHGDNGHQPWLPGSPLKGPTSSGVIQPP